MTDDDWSERHFAELRARHPEIEALLCPNDVPGVCHRGGDAHRTSHGRDFSCYTWRPL